MTGEFDLAKLAELLEPKLTALRRDRQRQHAERILCATFQVGSRSARGSAFAVRHDKSAFLLTNAHVVEGRSEIRAIYASDLKYNYEFSCEIVAIDYVNDLALLQPSQANGFKQVVELLLSAGIEFGADAQHGDDILLCGFPLGCDQPRLARGIVSGYAELEIEGRKKRRLVVQAPVNPGSSGGPICDLDGNLVGVLYAGEHKIRIDDPLPDVPGAREMIEYLRPRLTANDGYGYALDLDHVRAMVETVIDSRPDGRHLDGEVWNTFEMPRRDFVSLQSQIDQLKEKKPTGTSCIGPFNFWEDKLRLGWKGKSQVELTPPASWIRMCKSKLNKMSHFYLRGHTVVGYKKAPGYKQARWVNQTEIVLT